MSLRLHNFGGGMRSHLPAAMLASGVHHESDGHALHQPVLVLNASYEPINVCAARRAIVLVLKGVAMTEEENGHFLHAARVTKKYSAARSQHLPVLQHYASIRRAYAGSRDPAIARRPLYLGESRGLLPCLQPPQRQSVSARS
jgi:hypothetical protein